MHQLRGIILGCLILVGLGYFRAPQTHPGALSAQADAAAILSLPVVIGSIGGAVTVPVSLAPQSNLIYSMDLVVGYDAQVVELTTVELGPRAENWTLAVNSEEAGQVQIGLAGSEPILNNGTVLLLAFNVVTQVEQTGAVWFDVAQLNEGIVSVQPVAGQIIVYIPTPTATPTITPTPSLTPTGTATSTVTATSTLTPMPTQTSTIVPDATPSATSTAMATGTQTPTPLATPTPTLTVTMSPTPTPTTTRQPDEKLYLPVIEG